MQTDLLPARQPFPTRFTPSRQAGNAHQRRSPIDRARAYLAKLPPAISGQGGHNAAIQAACVLVEFGLSPAEAWPILTDWNQTHCQPTWSEAELHHKLTDAFKRTGPKAQLADGRASRPSWKPRPGGGAGRRCLILPPLRPGSTRDCAQVAELRGLAREGIELANSKGLLSFGEFRSLPAWFITDTSGHVAQARRMDGQPWAQGVKALTVAGSQAAWPVGIIEAAGVATVALCEGGPDLLAACAFILAEGRGHDCAPVAMLGGCARIHPSALPLFAGKRVRIFVHADETGANAADRWAVQLTEAGADADAFSFAGLRRTDGAPVKDLCDLAAVHADDFENFRCVWDLMPREY